MTEQHPTAIRLTSLLGNSQRLDGGAMFGNAPRALWARLCPPDAENRIALGCRALLVEAAGRRVLLETGIGAFFPPKLKERFGVVEPEHVLLRSLAEVGLTDADITDVILSHLHFDHAGGLLAPYEEGAAPRLLFPNARFLVGAEALERALHPHTRDRASFIPELPALLAASGRLLVIRDRAETEPSLPFLRFRYSDGHTPGLLLTEVVGPEPSRAVLFAGDLVPGTAWVHLPMTMGYDRYPELLIDEKTALLGEIERRGAFLFYTHDTQVAMSRLARNAEGRMTPVDAEASFVRRAL
jgi:glyoxylase-like metal-dependent hydrolase (beta-lactamase superfamily II)